MQLENTGIDETIIDVEPLDRLMGKHAFIRAGQWDYERVTYDYKNCFQGKEHYILYPHSRICRRR